MLQPLPDPGPEAHAHSQSVLAHIRTAIAAEGGFLSFDRYMELALYAPGLGYYAAGAHKFGADGDFVTAPGLTPLFGQTLADTLAPVLIETNGNLLELGAGEGRLAADILNTLGNAVAARYHILEVSADLRDRQYQYINTHAKTHLEKVVWLDTLPDHFSGVILANEVLDALPVSLVHWHGTELFERGVCLEEGRLAWGERPLKQGPLFDAAQSLGIARTAFTSEISLAVPALVSTLSERLTHGAILLIDYGFTQSEYYHTERHEGTLMCHYRHLAHTDPLLWPCITDITAHVDFSTVAMAGLKAGCDLLGYTSQTGFLLGAGILNRLNALEPGSKAYLRAASALQKLLQPSEMGELFKVIGLGRGLKCQISGFSMGNRSHAL